MTRPPTRKADEKEPPVLALVLSLVALAVASSVFLDFLNGRRGEKSYLFPGRKESAAPAVPPGRFQDTLVEGLISAGIPRDSLEGIEDPELAARIVARVALPLYREAEEFLDRWTRDERISVAGKTRTEADGRIEFAWRLTSPGGEEGVILFVCPQEPPAKPVPKKPGEKPPAKAPSPRAGPGQVALIIDDMGSSLEALNDILSVGEHITVAVLPFSTFARETAELAHSRNLEVLLHLPLESQNNHEIAAGTDGMIFAGMDESEMLRILREDLAQVPFAKGVNNHMGSRLTTEASAMRTILGVLKQKGLFFVDSRTTAQTVAYEEALRMGVPAAKRDVFLDADEDRGMIRSRLLELFRTARSKGSAVGICHPFPETLRVLKEDFRLLADYGLEAVPVSRLLTGRD
jgi:polysaccharide deacetylase 2 family uncharacterized protein YibQ